MEGSAYSTAGARPRAGVAATLRAGLYGRNSKGLDKSIDDQLDEGREAAEERAWELVAEYSDAVSASRFGTKVRKDWQRLLKDLDAGLLDVVITWEPSRADRDLETWVAFVAKCRARGVLVHITGEDDTLDARNPSHWRRLIEGGVDAAMESEKISKRVRRGVAALAVAGGFHGDAPYGYERVIVGERATKHGPKPVKEQRPHPEHAQVVVEIFERIARNDPIVAIVRDLNERGVLAPAGERWNRNTVRNIAVKVAYIGQRSHKGEVHEGTWPGLVGADLFHAAGRVLADPARKKTQPGRMKYLLTYGVSTPCGGVVGFAGPLPGRQSTVGRYHCGTDGCVAIGQAEADEYLTRLVIKRVSRPDIRALFADDDEPTQRARDEAAALQAKLDEATESFYKLTGGISADRLAEIEAHLKPLIADAARRSVSTTAPRAMLDLMDAGRFGEEMARPVWDALPVPARREVLKLIFADIHLGKPVTRLTRWSTPEQRLTVAHQRISVQFRTPAEPPSRSGAKPASRGGAYAQRRRQTLVELQVPGPVEPAGVEPKGSVPRPRRSRSRQP
jgi:DNA invertase Pin-like site-specific DNA recombinase